MIADLRDDALPECIEAEVCVVGGGPVGIVLALALARAGIDVVLLESGGQAVAAETEALNESHVVGRWHAGIHAGRHRAIGGTSVRWGGQILPFEDIDFEHRPWIAGSGWPISFEELQPFYERALQYEGLGTGNLADREVWAALDLPTPSLGNEIRVHFSRWCPEPDFARLYRSEIEHSRNLRCILHATVTSVSVTDDTLNSALASSLNQRTVKVNARRFVFCGGAIETARLLLHPTAEGNVPPWCGEDSMLGRCFQDHPAFACADVVPRNRAALHRLTDMVYLRGRKYQPRFRLDAALQRALEVPSVGGHLVFRTRNPEALATLRTAFRELLRQPSPGRFLRAAKLGLENATFLSRQAWRYAVKRRALNPDDMGISLVAYVEQPPRESSRIELADDVDALGMRRVRLNWVLGEPELSAAAEFTAAMGRAMAAQGLADVTVDPALQRMDPAFLDTGWDNYHHMGTARAGKSVEEGFVDSKLRIFGAANGFVCGCSVFPTSGFSNPTHTALALAVRLADHLVEHGRH